MARPVPTRPSAGRSRIATEREDGILGDYGFERSGDPTVGPVTIFRANGTFERVDEVSPEPKLVNAARR